VLAVAKRELVRHLSAQGVAVDKIISTTGLSRAAVERLRGEMA